MCLQISEQDQVYTCGLKYIVIKSTFTGLKFRNFTMFNKTKRLKYVWKGKNIKIP